MAKLKAYGRKEVFRLVKTLPDNENSTDRKKEIAYMSDGNLLEKHTVRFKPDAYTPNGRLHSWGWKKLGKANPAYTPEQIKAAYEKQGYTEV